MRKKPDNVVSLLNEKKKPQKYLDSKGRAVPYFFVSRFTGVIEYRREFKKLGIPPLKFSTGETKIGLARTVAEIKVQKWMNKHLGIDDTQVFRRDKRGVTFRKIREEMKEKYRPKNKTGVLRKGSKALHAYYLDTLANYFESRDPETLTEEDFDQFVIYFRKENPSRKTFGDFAKFMNIFMRYAYQNKHVRHPIQFKNPDPGLVHEKRYYTKDEIDTLWAAFSESLKDLLSCIYESIMRKHMALELEWDRVNLETGEVTFLPEHLKTGSRNGKGQVKFLSPNTLLRLRARWERTKSLGSQYVFPMRKLIKDKKDPRYRKWVWIVDRHQLDLKGAWKTAKKKVGITGRAPWKDFRHTAFTKALLEKKLNPMQTTLYGGNSVRTAEKDYVTATSEHTREISEALRIEGKK